jgi:zinc resistance-associated protein
MWKPILAGTAALVVAGSSLVYAQQRFGGPDRAPPDRAQSSPAQPWQPSPEDRAAFIEARIAALHAGLQLSPEQDRNWPAFETAIRDLVKSRRERLDAWRNQPPAADPTERLKRRADALSSAGAALQRLAEAQGPLYASLDEGQKRRFAMLAQRLSPAGMGGPGMMGGEGMMRPGMGQGMDRHGMRDDRSDGRRDEHWREHHGYRGERRSDAEGDRGRDGREWRGDRGMEGRGGPGSRDERGRDGRDGRGMGRMGGEERL